MYQLIITNSNNEQLTFPLKGERGARISIGRSEDCDIALPQEMHLSRVHCHLSFDNGQAVLSDNCSSNGIYEDGERVNTIEMKPGKEYSIGSCTIILRRATPSLTGSKKPASKRPTNARKALVKRPPARPFYTAAGTLNTETVPAKPRQLKATSKKPKEHIKRAPSTPADEFGLPHDFELNFQLQNTEKTLEHGDLLRFAVQASEACYLYLIQYDSEKNAVMLLPGVAGADNKLPAMQTVTVPPSGKDGGYELYVEEPYGDDIILAIACTARSKFEKHWARCIAETDALLRRPGEAEAAAIQRCNLLQGAWSAAVLRITTG